MCHSSTPKNINVTWHSDGIALDPGDQPDGDQHVQNGHRILPATALETSAHPSNLEIAGEATQEPVKSGPRRFLNMQ